MSDVHTIDYEPLAADRHAFKLVLKRRAALSSAIFVVAVGVCFVSVWLGFALAVGWLFYLFTMVKAFKNGVWENFAIANGWSVDTELAPELLMPLSLQFGHSQSLSPVITAELGAVAADLFVYETVVGEGKSQQTFYFSVARVLLPATLPHMMLRAKKGVSSAVQQDFVNHETLPLEGDFNDYFSLQIEKGQEVDALEILTPDVMQTLVDYSQREDIEIAGDTLYFILSGDARTPEAVQTLVESVVRLSGQIVEQIVQIVAPAPPAPPANGAGG